MYLLWQCNTVNIFKTNFYILIHTGCVQTLSNIHFTLNTLIITDCCIHSHCCLLHGPFSHLFWLANITNNLLHEQVVFLYWVNTFRSCNNPPAPECPKITQQELKLNVVFIQNTNMSAIKKVKDNEHSCGKRAPKDKFCQKMNLNWVCKCFYNLSTSSIMSTMSPTFSSSSSSFTGWYSKSTLHCLLLGSVEEGLENNSQVNQPAVWPHTCMWSCAKVCVFYIKRRAMLDAWACLFPLKCKWGRCEN